MTAGLAKFCKTVEQILQPIYHLTLVISYTTDAIVAATKNSYCGEEWGDVNATVDLLIIAPLTCVTTVVVRNIFCGVIFDEFLDGAS